MRPPRSRTPQAGYRRRARVVALAALCTAATFTATLLTGATATATATAAPADTAATAALGSTPVSTGDMDQRCHLPAAHRPFLQRQHQQRQPRG